MTGKTIKAFRKQHDLTQEQLGERLGVTSLSVSYWETGRYKPVPYLALALESLACPQCEKRRKRAGKKAGVTK